MILVYGVCIDFVCEFFDYLIGWVLLQYQGDVMFLQFFVEGVQ